MFASRLQPFHTRHYGAYLRLGHCISSPYPAPPTVRTWIKLLAIAVLGCLVVGLLQPIYLSVMQGYLTVSSGAFGLVNDSLRMLREAYHRVEALDFYGTVELGLCTRRCQ